MKKQLVKKYQETLAVKYVSITYIETLVNYIEKVKNSIEMKTLEKPEKQKKKIK